MHSVHFRGKHWKALSSLAVIGVVHFNYLFIPLVSLHFLTFLVLIRFLRHIRPKAYPHACYYRILIKLRDPQIQFVLHFKFFSGFIPHVPSLLYSLADNHTPNDGTYSPSASPPEPAWDRRKVVQNNPQHQQKKIKNYFPTSLPRDQLNQHKQRRRILAAIISISSFIIIDHKPIFQKNEFR